MIPADLFLRHRSEYNSICFKKNKNKFAQDLNYIYAKVGVTDNDNLSLIS